MKGVFDNSFHIYDYWNKKSYKDDNHESIKFHVFRSVEAGKLVVKCQGKTLTVTQGEMLYIPPERHADLELYAEPNNCHGKVLRLRYLPNSDIIGYLPQSFKMTDEIKSTFNNLPLFHIYTDRVNSRVIGRVYKFLTFVQPQLAKYTNKHTAKIKKALQFMEENDKYTIPELAKYCGMSERRFYAVFKEILGATPIQIKQKIQAIKANALLKDTDLLIADVASQVGLSSTNQLRKIIKNRYDSLPSKRRKSQFITNK